MKTDHLGLILTDESEIDMTFLKWRTYMNGTGGNSNMQLIDSAISKINKKLENINDSDKATLDEVKQFLGIS